MRENKQTKMKNEIKSSFKSGKTRIKYKFALKTRVQYRGTLFDHLTNKEGVIVRRSSSKGHIYYDVDFENNDKIMSFAESVLHPVIIEEENYDNC